MRFAANHFSRLTLASVIALLCACGGGGGHDDDDTPSSGSNSGGNNSASAPSQTGTLTDSAVGGVRYETSGGYTGTTNASGHFLYNVGETVTFKIGDLTLGAITPTTTEATITPIELATSAGVVDTDKVTNLLVLLQSLDSDGNADNGISIGSSAATALTGSTASSIVLTADPTSFSTNPNLSSVVTEVNGSSATVVSTAQALEHFKETFMNQLVGTWVFADPNSEDKIVFRFNVTGDYIMGEHAPTGEGGNSGIERGNIAWEPTTGKITESNISNDTNGEWGLSHPFGEELFFAMEGDDTLAITVKEEGQVLDTLRLTRVQASSNSIAGTWALDDGRDLGEQQFIFFASGQYMMLDPIGDEEGAQCGQAGLEIGSYSFINNELSFSDIIEDTNGCAGLHDDDVNEYATFPATLNNATGILTLDENGDNIYLYRAGVAPIPD